MSLTRASRVVSRLGSSRLQPVLGCTRKLSTSKAARAEQDGWETVIGLEIHAQLRTGRKLFSQAKTTHDDPVNAHVELLDAAYPGSLPVVDLEAIRLSILTALALGCTINPRSTFDRKHYFYHDIPASYQITQHYNPLARNGVLSLGSGEGLRNSINVGIKQLQVEQDTAKSSTIAGRTYVDLNRAGTGLMEIVTEPDMRSAEEAGAFVRKLQALLRRVGSGDGDMEKGNLRVDANVSVHRPGQPFGTRCEIKNLNSIRFLQQAVESERRRHIQHYLSTSDPLKQETRGLNEITGETYALRSKEEAEDYRYMPDSNLPAMVIPAAYVQKLRSSLPEMPWQTVSRLHAVYGVAPRDVETLIGLDEYTLRGVRYYEDVTLGEAKLGKRAINWIAHELLGQLGKSGKEWNEALIPAPLMRQLVVAVDDGIITGTTGKAIIRHCISASAPVGTDLQVVLDKLGLSPVAGADLESTCRQVIQALPTVSEAVRKGNEKVVMRLVGEVMKVSHGGADAKKAREILLGILKGKT